MRQWQIVVEFHPSIARPSTWYWEVYREARADEPETMKPMIAAGRASTMTEMMDDIDSAIDGDMHDC